MEYGIINSSSVIKVMTRLNKYKVDEYLEWLNLGRLAIDIRYSFRVVLIIALELMFVKICKLISLNVGNL